LRPGRHNLKIHSAGTGAVDIDEPKKFGDAPISDYLVVSNNVFNSLNDAGVWATVAYQPQNKSSAEGVRNGIFENNHHIRGNWPSAWGGGTFGGQNILQRGDTALNPKHGNELNSRGSKNIDALPEEWDGPYLFEN